MYDIIFLSHSEVMADVHWEKLRTRFPRAHRVDKVDGIVAAHKRAATIAETRWFWTVDADNVVSDDFDFSFHWAATYRTSDTVAVWRAQNNVNGLTYGYGGIKLLPRLAVLRVPDDVVDFTTSIGENFKVMTDVVSTTIIDSTPFEAWKSGFRECAKLSSNIIERSHSDESLERLATWCNIDEAVGPNAEMVIRGAREGKQFGLDNVGNREALLNLNNYRWLRNRYDDK